MQLILQRTHIFRLTILFTLLSAVYISYASERAILSLENKHQQEFTEPLNVKWEFYWKQLLAPSDFQIKKTEPTAWLVPGSWSDVEIKGEKIGTHGFATYKLSVTKLPKQKLILDAYSIQTSYRIFINENLVAEIGKVGTTKQTTQPMNRDVQIDIPAEMDSICIIVQVANFHHRKGGFVHPFRIGSADVIKRQHQLYYYLDFIESSALAIIGLFLLALYVFRRKDLSILYFALFCVTLSFRPVISVNYLLGDLFPNISWSFMVKLEYLSMLLPCLFIVLFIKKLFPKQLPAWVVKLLVPVLLLEVLITLVCPPVIFSWLTLTMIVIIPFGVLMFAISIIRAIVAREEGAWYAGIGLVILLISQLLKVLSYAGVIPAVHVLITVLDIGFIFSMSMILGSRFSRQFVKVEQLQQQMEQKNKEILDSISYARRLQDAILPSENAWKKQLPGSFIFYKPKDIVAGDFYFLEKVGNTIIVAAADCTGHGVPGALVSVVCSNALSRSVKEFELTDPGKILDKTRELVLGTFSANEMGVKDGMDIALCALEFETRDSKFETGNNFKSQILNFKFAGANNPLWIINNGVLHEIKADKQPIGYTDKPKPFTTHTISNLESQISNIFLFTDGFADQFGGDKSSGKKFKYSRLKELLREIHALPPQQQLLQLDSTLKTWMGDIEQIDDICIIGVKL